MLFNDLKTEKDVDVLKRKVVNDPVLYDRILEIRQIIHPKNDKTTTWIKFKDYAGSKKKKMPTNAEMLAFYREMLESGEQEVSKEAEQLLKKIKSRSNSGVAVVSVLTKPYACPGQCIYCPTEVNMPKSYLSKEPAAARALRNDFSPYKQTETRLRALEINGHPTDKLEFIIIGGTWSFYNKVYQEEFVAELFRAANNYNNDTKIEKGEKTLEELQKINTDAKCKIIGLSIETRPDYINEEELNRLRYLGVTKVEIGVQHLDNDILEYNKRDMTKESIAEVTELLRDAGFKVVYHMMPNLPGSNPKKDIAMFEELFAGEDFQPDMLKIYPCMVLKKSLLYDIWKQGGFKSYEDKQLTDILIAAKKKIPLYVRIIRVIRDIPADYIMSGSKISNLRQLIEADQKKNNWRCKCIRCREIRNQIIDPGKFKLSRVEYKTKEGVEIFLSYENEEENKTAAFLRLRLPNGKRAETFKDNLAVLKDSAIIRELHTYGQLIPVEEKGSQSQHMGYGMKLVEEAERVASEAGFKKISVISGVGVRGYYERKLGYHLDRTYMVKEI